MRDYNMIGRGDRIMIGLSGGKDSLLLSLTLATLLARSPVKFELRACVIDQTGSSVETAPLLCFMNELGIETEVVNHPTYEIMSLRDERSPCGLCANMRRGILAHEAKRKDCNVLALGHHKDDAAETVMLNLFYGGRFKCYHPHLYMSRTKIRVIRPFSYIEERKIAVEAERLGLPVMNSCCPYGDDSKRKISKEILADLSQTIPDLKSNIIHALKNFSADEVWKDGMLGDPSQEESEFEK